MASRGERFALANRANADGANESAEGGASASNAMVAATSTTGGKFGKQATAGGAAGGGFSARKYERAGLKQDEIEEIKEAFDLFDTDQSGAIELRELRSAMQSLGYECKNETIFTMLQQLDRDGSASLDFEEFLVS